MAKKSQVDIKARLNLKLDRDLKNWVMQYASSSGTTVSNLIRDFFTQLQRREARHAEGVEQI